MAYIIICRVEISALMLTLLMIDEFIYELGPFVKI